MRRSLILAFLLIATASALGQQGQVKPNFTGIWNVDLEKSDFGGLEVPKSARYLIRQLGSKLEMQYEQDEHVTRVDVIPDGEEHVLETGPDTENLARVYWSGSALVFEGRIRPMPGSNAPNVKWNSRWTLSPDKKVFTIERHISTDQATADQKVVFNKQPATAKAQPPAEPNSNQAPRCKRRAGPATSMGRTGRFGGVIGVRNVSALTLVQLPRQYSR